VEDRAAGIHFLADNRVIFSTVSILAPRTTKHRGLLFTVLRQPEWEVPRLKMRELYFHFFISLCGVMLN
jgi:hypothetical protein